MTRAPDARDAAAARRVAHGDWQTPASLARQVTALLRAQGLAPRTVVEPTCGRGAFVAAALEAFPDARVEAWELSDAHLADAREALAGTRATLHRADFLEVDWAAELAAREAPLLLLGNPPWVTASALGALGALGASNVPVKRNDAGLRGLDARTGRADFDLSEWMILRLLEAAAPRPFTLAMLCKSSVARRILAAASARGWPLEGSTRALDARAHFDVAVDAALLTVTWRPDAPTPLRWPAYDALEATSPARATGVLDGAVVADLDAALRTRHLEGPSRRAWRSGMKHDCAAVMELRREGGALVNGLGARVELEPEVLFPLAKGSDVANGRAATGRLVLVPQRHLGDDTARLRDEAPRAWAYLEAHRHLLDARRSSIYRGRCPFAVFGVGPYTFAPWKVAVCGLYKRLRFAVVGPVDGRPVVLDDTAYFVACDTADEATALRDALEGDDAQAFFRARIAWDAKRPVSKALLGALSLDALTLR